MRSCDATAARAPTQGCAYVWYNLAPTFHDEADTQDSDDKARMLYAQAAERFERAVDLLKPCEKMDVARQAPCRLLAEALQSQAYGLAKQAELNPAPTDEELAAVSRKSDQAIQALRRLGEDVPPDYRLTLARIRLMRHEWEEVAVELKELRDSPTDATALSPRNRAELYLLLA